MASNNKNDRFVWKKGDTKVYKNKSAWQKSVKSRKGSK